MYLGHITGRGHLTIPVHAVPYLLPWTASPSSMTPSLSYVTFDVRLGQGTPIWSLPGHPSP